MKLTDRAAGTYLTAGYCARYGMGEYPPVFKPTGDFIAGLRKSAIQLLQLFGGLALLMGVFQFIAVIVLCRIYATTRCEAIGVKRLLGHPLWRIFGATFLMVVIVSAVTILACIMLGSAAGIVAAGIMLIVQLVTLSWQSRRLATSLLRTLITAE